MPKKKKKQIGKIIVTKSLYGLVWDPDRKEYNRLSWYVEHIRRLYDFENRNNI
ncbi:MAG: hypothetical protein ACFFEY_15660 [Candidatus Thorarchaeota archaeon]